MLLCLSGNFGISIGSSGCVHFASSTLGYNSLLNNFSDVEKRERINQKERNNLKY